MLLTAWKSIQGVAVEEVEALACREGLHLTAEWIHKPMILESDCSRIIGYLSQRQKQRAPAFFTIQDALSEAGKLPQVVFRHIRREQNVIAHEFVQLARRLNHSAVWRGRFPACVEHLVSQDVIPLD